MIKTLMVFLIVILFTSCNLTAKKSSSNKNPQLVASMERGKLVYDDMCITCHLADGKGVPKVFPPLAKADYLRDNQDASIKGIKKGMSGEIEVNSVTYNSIMTSLGLSNKEVADVMNYINNSWGNDYGKLITPQDVTNIINK